MTFLRGDFRKQHPSIKDPHVRLALTVGSAVQCNAVQCSADCVQCSAVLTVGSDSMSRAGCGFTEVQRSAVQCSVVQFSEVQ
jgi:hypothetical protein